MDIDNDRRFEVGFIKLATPLRVNGIICSRPMP